MDDGTNDELQSTSLEKLLQSAAGDLRNAFDRAAEVKHRGERGRLRETQVLDFLADRLPQSYSVGTGQVVDSRGFVSGQMDGLVFHSASSPKLFTERSNAAYQPGLFFIESVAAAISVKSRLDKKELIDSFTNIASVKSLSKDYSEGASVVAGDTRSTFNQFGPRQPPVGVVFAYSSVSPKTLMRHIHQICRDLLADGGSGSWTILPEFVFVLDSCLIHTPAWYGPASDREGEGRQPSAFDHFTHLPMISCELDCGTNPVMSNFFTSFVERMLEVPILRVGFDRYTRGHLHGPTLWAFPAHTVRDSSEVVHEGSIDVRRIPMPADESEANPVDGE